MEANLKTMPTPLFLLYTSIVKRQLKVLKETFPGMFLYYSLKTNPHPSIIRIMQDAGFGFQVCSLEELKLLKNAKVLFYNPSCNKQDFEKLKKLGIKRITADSEEQLKEIPDEIDAYLRVNVGVKSSSCFLNTQFGASMEDAERLMHVYSIKKIHCHIGSQITELAAWKDAGEKLLQLAKKMPVEEINLGGGFPVKYGEAVPTIGQIREQLIPLLNYMSKNKIELSFETGRFITAEAMKLATRIKQVKGSMAFVDASVYNAHADILNAKIKLPASQKGNKKYTIRGCTPDSLDIFGEYSLPELKEGDLLTFEMAGAYQMSTGFMHLKKPRTVVK